MRIDTTTLPISSIGWWVGEAEDVDFDPVFQRSSHVWTIKDKQSLIDSILNGFDIPKFYFYDFTGQFNELNRNREKYAIIDGKQRLSAIIEFINCAFPLDKDFKFLNDPEIEIAGLHYEEIKLKYPKVIRKFDNFPLTVIGVKTNELSLISELFLRLNKGKPLTGAELRNAKFNDVVDCIRELSNHKFFRENSFNITRLQNFDAASKLLLIETEGGFQDTKKSNLDRLADSKPEPESLELARERIQTVLDYMNLFSGGDAYKSTGLFPVIYWLFRNHPDKAATIIKESNEILYLIKQKSEIDYIKSFRLHNRNTNDKGSLEARYNIILERI